jgi:outer membrane lipoprotein carrier protein
MTRFKSIVALSAGLLIAGFAQASALEQFKSFVASTKAA